MARRHAIVFGFCVFLLCQVFRGEAYSQITFSDGSIQKQIIFVQPGQKTLNLSLPEGLSFTHVGLQISGEDAHVLKWFYGFQDFPFLPGGVRGTDTAFDRPRKFQAQSFISPFSGHIEAIRICLALGPCGGLSISLRSDAGGLPGAILVEDKSYRHAIMPEAIPFQVSLAYSLQAGQEYWLVAEMTEDGGLAATHRGGDDHYSDGVFIWGDGQSYRAEASQENQEVLT